MRASAKPLGPWLLLLAPLLAFRPETDLSEEPESEPPAPAPRRPGRAGSLEPPAFGPHERAAVQILRSGAGQVHWSPSWLDKRAHPRRHPWRRRPHSELAEEKNLAEAAVVVRAQNATKPSYENATSREAAAFDVSRAGQRVMEALRKEDLRALRAVLALLSPALERDALCFDVNAAAGNATVLEALAKQGWLPGLQEMERWDQGRRDKGLRLRVDGPGLDGTTPLLAALESGHIAVAEHLLRMGASVAVRDAHGRTPLEVAASMGSAELAGEVMAAGAVLKDGLLALRLSLRKEAAALPRLQGRWQQAKDGKDLLQQLRGVVPPALWPRPAEMEVVGGEPGVWILFYENKVMCAFAQAVYGNGKPGEGLQRLLVKHDYHGFLRDFSLSCVLLSCIVLLFGVLTYLAFRTRLYGWCETPVSLADHIPGAFDPLRLVDPDFDPARMKPRLPYLTAKEYLGPQAAAWEVLAASFFRALLGVFSAWSLQFVRIPPEKDPYDEDYLSEDDEDRRGRVRQLAMGRAARVRCAELYLRNGSCLVLVLWLTLRARRWGEAAVLALLFSFHAWLASSVAGCAVPAPRANMEPEKTPDDPTLDCARVVQALFSVQHGPRWTRAICSTRSTAAPNNTTKARWLRRRQRRQHQAEERTAEGASPKVAEADETAFSDWFQRSFLQSGMLHVSHGALLACCLASMLLVAVVLMWLGHGRRLFSGDWGYRYAWVSPTQLMRVYGAPGSLRRGVATLLELLLLFFAGERLHGILSLLNVAFLSLRQRHHSLRFARRHQPAIADPKEAVSLNKAALALEECVRCFDFALDLSGTRWAVLREPSFIALLCTLKFLLAALLLLAAPFAGPAGARWLREGAFWMGDWSMLDPFVPLLLGCCLAWPVLALLCTGLACNREVRLQQDQMRLAVEALSSLASAAGVALEEVQYVQLKIRANEALQHCLLRWPGGRALGFSEPLLLLALLAAAGGLALLGGAG